jgi:hypothetical protein
LGLVAAVFLWHYGCPLHGFHGDNQGLCRQGLGKSL